MPLLCTLCLRGQLKRDTISIVSNNIIKQRQRIYWAPPMALPIFPINHHFVQSSSSHYKSSHQTPDQTEAQPPADGCGPTTYHMFIRRGSIGHNMSRQYAKSTHIIHPNVQVLWNYCNGDPKQSLWLVWKWTLRSSGSLDLPADFQ